MGSGWPGGVASGLQHKDFLPTVLLIDDLTDTGKTAKIVREILPDAHFATVYAKPAGAPMCHTFVTEVSQDTWIYFPWDLDLKYVEPIRDGARPAGKSES